MDLIPHVPSTRDHGSGAGPAAPSRSPQPIHRDAQPDALLPQAAVATWLVLALAMAHRATPGGAAAGPVPAKAFRLCALPAATSIRRRVATQAYAYFLANTSSDTF